MPKHKPTKLTERFIRSLPFAAKDERDRALAYVVRDTEVRGLMVVVHGESKSYVLQRDLYAPLQLGERRRRLVGTRRVRLGDARQLLPDDARREARKVVERMEAGEDPNAPPLVPPVPQAVLTLGEAWDRYRDRCQRKGRSQSTIDGYQYQLDRYLGDWLTRPLAEIGADRLGVDKRHRDVTANHGPYAANQTMRALRAIYRHALKKDPTLPPVPPTEAVDFNEEHSRTEVVTDWPAWWARIQELRNPVTRDWYIFVALTGMRREAACVPEVAHFRPDEGFLHVPRPKGGARRAFDLPLSGHLVELLRRRIADNAAVRGKACRWIFPSHFSEKGHVTEPEVRGMPSPHVLRHSYGTAAKAAGLPELDIKLLLNHKLPGVTGVYIHGTALGDHLRECQEKVTRYLLGRRRDELTTLRQAA